MQSADQTSETPTLETPQPHIVPPLRFQHRRNPECIFPVDMRKLSETQEIKNIMNQLQHSVKSLTNTVGQGEDRLSELEDKVEELEQSNVDKYLKKK